MTIRTEFYGATPGRQLWTGRFLVIVLIADAAQNGLRNQYGSVAEGLILVLTIVCWEYLIDWLHYRYPALRPLLIAPQLTLIDNGPIRPISTASCSPKMNCGRNFAKRKWLSMTRSNSPSSRVTGVSA